MREEGLLRAESIALFVGAGVIFYMGIVAWSGSEATLEALRQIGLGTAALGTLIASSAYLLRFARWDLLLRSMQHRLPFIVHLRIYLSGLALTTTPGKIGETIRTTLLLPRGVSIPHSLAAFIADRLSDVLAVALLGVVAGRVGRQHQTVLELLTGFVLVGSLLLGLFVRSTCWNQLFARAATSNWFGRALVATNRSLTVWAQLWSVPRVAVCAALAFVAYGMQALVFHAYVAAVGAQVPAFTCIAIFASSTLIGAASMVPGGLGAMETSLVYQLIGAGATRDEAVAAVLATRLSTLWTGVLLGSLMLLTFSRDSRALQRAARTQRHPDD